MQSTAIDNYHRYLGHLLPLPEKELWEQQLIYEMLLRQANVSTPTC